MFNFSKRKNKNNSEQLDELPKKDIIHLLENIKPEKVESPNKKEFDINKTQLISQQDFIKTNYEYIENLLSNLEMGSTFARKFDIYEVGMYLGIFIGKTDKNKAMEILEEFSDCRFPRDEKVETYLYEDLSLEISFDENNIVKEIVLGSHYKGQTSKVLRIGDTVETVLKIYGEPSIKGKDLFAWNTFSVCFENDLVSKIKIHTFKT